MNLSTKEITAQGQGDLAAWFPDGDYLIYQISEDNGHNVTASDLYVIKADGTEKTQLTFTSDVIEQFTDWSPSGDKIVFYSYDSGKLYTADIVKN